MWGAVLVGEDEFVRCGVELLLRRTCACWRCFGGIDGKLVSFRLFGFRVVAAWWCGIGRLAERRLWTGAVIECCI